jgi:hypothetical protein
VWRAGRVVPATWNPKIRFMPSSWRASKPEQDSRHYSRKVGRARKTVFTEGGDEKDGNINH